jgi:hypothetical protein
MAIKKTQQGFALLISVIFMSVMLTFGLALASLAYKQQILASNAIESQYAFYAADAALECALYADQQLNIFVYQSPQPASAPIIQCDGINATYPPTYPTGIIPSTGPQWVITERISLDAGNHCADFTIYKPPSGSGKTYIFSQGYNIPCASVATGGNNSRFVSRGLSAHYGI